MAAGAWYYVWWLVMSCLQTEIGPNGTGRHAWVVGIAKVWCSRRYLDSDSCMFYSEVKYSVLFCCAEFQYYSLSLFPEAKSVTPEQNRSLEVWSSVVGLWLLTFWRNLVPAFRGKQFENNGHSPYTSCHLKEPLAQQNWRVNPQFFCCGNLTRESFLCRFYV
jgi:hypothetical protein